MRGLLGTRRLLERAGQKAMIQTSDLTGGSAGGRLNPEQADRFIDYVVNQAVIFRDGIRIRRMNSDRADLDQLKVGARTLRKATEGTAPGALVGITTSKRQLVVTEMILPADVTFSFIEDNIEREDFEDHLMAVFGTQLANDLEDLAINGDGATPSFLSIEQGWLYILQNDVTTNVFDTNGGVDFRNVVWEGMLEALPTKFKGNKGALRFYTSSANEEKYRFQLGQRQTAGGDTVLMGSDRVAYGGIPVVGVPYFPETHHLLTLPDNLVVGIRRNISLGRFRNERSRNEEFTWTLRADFEVVEPTAAVLGYDAP